MDKIYSIDQIKKCVTSLLPNQALFALGDEDKVKCASIWIKELESSLADERNAKALLEQKLVETEKELNQQRFNNEHNLSIDQKVSDRITELEQKLAEAENRNKELYQSNVVLNESNKDWMEQWRLVTVAHNDLQDKLSSLTAKANEGFDEWLSENYIIDEIFAYKKKTGNRPNKYDVHDIWKTSRLPLVAKLEEMEHKIKVILDNGLGADDLNYTHDGHVIGEKVPTTKKKLSIAVEALKKITDDSWTRGGIVAHTNRSLAEEALKQIGEV